ncbi:MAG: hypothetical protein ABWZ98_10610 [Nakamurella sp.]
MFDDCFPDPWEAGDDSGGLVVASNHPAPTAAASRIDTGADRHQVLRELRHRISTVAVDAAKTATPQLMGTPEGIPAIDGTGQLLPVAEPLAAVLPRGGIARGSVISVRGSGATSLLFTLLSGPPEAWSAIVGMPGVGLLAAAEFGVDLARVVVVPEPGPDVLQVLSILMDGVDMIAVALPPTAAPAPARQRVLTGRLRQRGAVLLVMGPWPGADLVLTASWEGWTGLGQGHGRLRDRELVVDVAGRGAAAGRGHRAALLLRSGRSAVEIVAAPLAPTRVEPAVFEPVAEVS